MNSIVVVGSINMDLVVTTARVPKAGETIFGQTFATIPGGKGANQAVAASRLGGAVKMVGAVGLDGFGEQLLDSLAGSGVDVQEVIEKQDCSTGTATIIVDASGDNRIIVVPGANWALNPEDISHVKELIASASLLVLQLEVPMSTVEVAVEIATQARVPVMLNPAPACKLSDEFLRRIHYLIVNESEAELITDCAVTDVASAFEAAKALRVRGVSTAIVTLGADGAVVISAEERFHSPAKVVKVVDTTAAGDTFVGALAAACVEGKPISEAVKLAVLAGTLAVTRLGAQSSIPTKDELHTFIHFQGAQA